MRREHPISRMLFSFSPILVVRFFFLNYNLLSSCHFPGTGLSSHMAFSHLNLMTILWDIMFLFYRWENWQSKGLGIMLWVTQQVRDKAQNWNSHPSDSNILSSQKIYANHSKNIDKTVHLIPMSIKTDQYH